MENPETCSTSCDETPPCVLGLYFWSSTLCNHIPFFIAQLIGAILICVGTLYALFLTSQDIRKTSPHPGSFDSTNHSSYCPQCGALWRTLSSSCAPLFNFPTSSLSLSLKNYQNGSFEKAETKVEENGSLEVKFCPFHGFRDSVKVYACLSLYVTSLWFFIWQNSHPIHVFGVFLLMYSILVYLPFLYVLYQCHQVVEYDRDFSTPMQDTDRMERNVEVIFKLLHQENDDIIMIGKSHQPEMTGGTTEWLRAPIVLLGFFCLISMGPFIVLQTAGILWFVPIIIVLPVFPMLVSKVFMVEKIYTLLAVCSQSLFFVTFDRDNVVVYSVKEPAQLSNVVFLSNFNSSSEKTCLLPCQTKGQSDDCDGGFPLKEGTLQSGELLSQSSGFPCRSQTFYQFECPGAEKKFQELSWFCHTAKCHGDLLDLPTKSVTTGLGIGAVVLLFGLVVFNLFFSRPSVPLLLFFLGYLRLWGLSSRSSVVLPDENLPVWSQAVFPSSSNHLL